MTDPNGFKQVYCTFIRPRNEEGWPIGPPTTLIGIYNSVEEAVKDPKREGLVRTLLLDSATGYLYELVATAQLPITFKD